MTLVSFIVPVYNVEKYIHQCVDSILNQTYKNIEVILVDDGSPDKCPQICEEYEKKDERVRVIHKINAGVDEARNTGIDNAKGEWVYFVDSDDWIELDATERLLGIAKAHSVDCVMSDCVERYDDGTSKRIHLFTQKLHCTTKKELEQIEKYILCHRFSPYYTNKYISGYAAPWGKFVKLSILKDNNIKFNPYSKGVFDDGIYSLYLLEHLHSLYYADIHTYNYRIIGTSLTRKYNPNAIDVLSRGCELVDRFIKQYSKDSDFYVAESCRRVAFFSNYLAKYYFNEKNTETYKQLRRHIIEDLKKFPFRSAFERAEYKYLDPKHRFILYCGRHRLILGMYAYATAKKVSGRRS